MSRMIGIELGSGVVRVGALAQRRKQWSLTRFAERAVPLSDENEGFPEAPLVEAINEVFDRHDLPRDQVAVSLPAHRCVFRYFAVDFTSDEQIRKIIKYEAENHLPTTSIEDVVVNYYKIAEDAERTHLLVSIVEKKLIRSVLQVLTSCRIDPLTIDIDLLAALNTYSRFDLLASHRRLLLVDVGEQASNVSVVVDGQLQFIRSPKLGVASMRADEDLALDDPQTLDDLDLSAELSDFQLDVSDLEKDLVISFSTLEDGAEDPGDPQTALEAREQRKRERFLNRLVQELRRTIMSARKGQPERIYLTGPGSELDAVRDAIGDSLKIPVETPEFLDALPHTLGEDVDPDRCNACLATVLGLGLKLLGLDESGAELRREEFRFARTFEQVQTLLVAAVCLVFALALLICFRQQQVLTAAQSEYVEVLTAGRQLYLNHHGERPAVRMGARWTKLPRRSRIAALQQSLEEEWEQLNPDESGETPQVRPALALWRGVFDALERWSRQNRDQFRLRELRIDQQGMLLVGTARTQRAEIRLWGAIRRIVEELPELERATQPEASQPAEGGTGWNFTYRLERKEEEEE